ncbi:MAG: hypothetical protein U9R01_08695 [candidate division WOR-3 bacterium]|nr:hypothetical protein [candidate division WOR-3 bacterium]
MIPWKRKLYRIGVGIIFPLIYYFSPDKIIVLSFLFYLLGIMTTVEILRRVAPGAWQVMAAHSKGILKAEPGRVVGTTNFLIAALLVIIFLPKSIAITAILFLVFGDAVSTLIGMRFGKIKLMGGKKSLEGSLSFFLICMGIGLGLMQLPRIELTFWLILFGALVATITELLSISLDDNLTVAPITGIVMEIVRRVAII